MELEKAQEKFINAWGGLGSSWGINKTMAQIHALMLISAKPLSTDEIMSRLQISRGNANMNVRALIDWGLIEKISITGERKEFFEAEKDIWEVARRVARERRKREIEPVRRLLEDLQNVEGGDEDELNTFKEVTKDIDQFVEKGDNMLDKFVRSDEHWFYKTLVKMMR